jgi:hypothetical protein
MEPDSWIIFSVCASVLCAGFIQHSLNALIPLGAGSFAGANEIAISTQQTLFPEKSTSTTGNETEYSQGRKEKVISASAQAPVAGRPRIGYHAQSVPLIFTSSRPATAASTHLCTFVNLVSRAAKEFLTTQYIAITTVVFSMTLIVFSLVSYAHDHAHPGEIV